MYSLSRLVGLKSTRLCSSMGSASSFGPGTGSGRRLRRFNGHRKCFFLLRNLHNRWCAVIRGKGVR